MCSSKKLHSSWSSVKVFSQGSMVFLVLFSSKIRGYFLYTNDRITFNPNYDVVIMNDWKWNTIMLTDQTTQNALGYQWTRKALELNKCTITNQLKGKREQHFKSIFIAINDLWSEARWVRIQPTAKLHRKQQSFSPRNKRQTDFSNSH